MMLCPLQWFKTWAPHPNFGLSQETSSHKRWNTFAERTYLVLKILLLIYCKETLAKSKIFKN